VSGNTNQMLRRVLTMGAVLAGLILGFGGTRGAQAGGCGGPVPAGKTVTVGWFVVN
jgi:hypothetical protein